MAASTRALTPTHSGPFTAASAIHNTSTYIPPGDPTTPNSLRTQAAATSALRVSHSPNSPRLSPQPVTSTAATMSDERRQRDQKTRDAPRGISPNPATQAAKEATMATDAAANRPRDAAPVAAPPHSSKPAEKMTKSIVIPENVSGDNLQTSPVSLSSFGSVEGNAQTATVTEPAAAGQLAIDNVPGQDRSTPQPQTHPPPPGSADGSASRAFTFPGPLSLEHDPRAPQRGMSMPMPGYAQGSPKSPNTKRHKCPYCSTDFTRHHNLKSHLLTHSQEKPYECPDCHARFRRLHDLKRHTKLHTGERPHICPKCGRRFARGDALARHNKGQGGCAGRRSSFAGDEDMTDARDDNMDGLEYHGGDGDDSRMDDDGEQGDGSRRVSEPVRRQDSRQASLQAGYNQHSSTYPPVAAAAHGLGNSIRSIYQQTSSSQSANVFAQGGMTESPKPISPGQGDLHRLGASESGSLVGNRSPNLSQHVLPQQYGSRGGKGSSPMGLPPPPTANAPQLPSLPGLAPSMTGRGPTSKPGAPTAPSMLQHQIPGSNPGSHSSHGGSSGGSIRDVLGGRDIDMWAYIRDLEARTQSQNEQYEARIQQLEKELTSLKSQLGQQAQQSPQQAVAPAPQPPPPPIQ